MRLDARNSYAKMLVKAAESKEFGIMQASLDIEDNAYLEESEESSLLTILEILIENKQTDLAKLLIKKINFSELTKGNLNLSDLIQRTPSLAESLPPRQSPENPRSSCLKSILNCVGMG